MWASLGTKDLSWSSTTFFNATLIATISARYIDVVEPAGASTKCSSWLWLSMMSAPASPSQHPLNTDAFVYISIAADPSLLIVSLTISRLNSAVSSLCTRWLSSGLKTASERTFHGAVGRTTPLGVMLNWFPGWCLQQLFSSFQCTLVYHNVSLNHKSACQMAS